MTSLRDELMTSTPARLAMIGPRTAAYLSHSLTRPLAPGRSRHPGIPTRLTTVGMAASVLVDEVAMVFMPALGGQCDDDYFSRVREETDRATVWLTARGLLDDPVSYHQSPPPPRQFVTRSRQFGHVRYEHLCFDSGFVPPAGMPGAERWAAGGPNAEVHAFVLRHRGGTRPWLINLHGLMMGEPSDLVALRAMHWFRDRGFNVIQPVAPLHGVRGRGRRHGAELISLDYLNNVHGMSQAVWDIRRCVRWVGEQGAPGVILHGISLGGYLAALVAAVDNRIDRVVAGMPLVDIAGVGNRAARHIRQLIARHDLSGGRAALVHRVVSPVAYPCRVERTARYIYAGVADRFTTAGQAYQLWTHWEEPSVLWFAGSHITDWVGEKRAFLDTAIGSAQDWSSG
jgi:hypothetical protein